LPVLATLLALALAAPAASDTAPPAAPPASGPATAPAKAVDDDPLVCRSETPIGTKLPKRTCIKKSERDRQKRESQEALQLYQRRSDGPSPERK
jgi:hypothetical protein